VIAAYGRHLATSGGRGAGPAAPATVRVHLSMGRALARELGLDEAVVGARVPRHEPGPPETLTDNGYANLLRVPDRRTIAGKREGRPRAQGTGPRGRPASARGVDGGPSAGPWRRAARRAAAVRAPRPPRRSGACPPLSCRRARLVHRNCLAAGVPERLAHSHALQAHWATHLLVAGVPVHDVSARLGHVDLRTTARYTGPRPERVDDIAEVLDRRHGAARRAGWGRKVKFGAKACVERPQLVLYRVMATELLLLALGSDLDDVDWHAGEVVIRGKDDRH